MAYGTPSDPVGGTVITVAYAVANLLDPIRWLRLLTGNADPPGSSYVVVSDSTTGTTWRKIPTDAIADGAVTTVKIADLGVTAAKLSAGVGSNGFLLGNSSGALAWFNPAGVTVGSATSAGSATNATNATTATNALQLDSLAPSDYLRSIGPQNAAPGSVTPSTSYQTLALSIINLTRAGQWLVTITGSYVQHSSDGAGRLAIAVNGSRIFEIAGGGGGVTGERYPMTVSRVTAIGAAATASIQYMKDSGAGASSFENLSIVATYASN